MVAGAVAIALALGGCGAGDGENAEVVVFAAASLREAFAEVGEEYEAANPQTTVTFVFAGSATLATQISEGAPGDVFAAANPATMASVVEAGRTARPPVVFARNRLVIAVERGNPKGVGGLADLARPGVTVALCAEQVPCGAAAKAALAAANVALTPVTLEQDVRAALSKVVLGEVDAALVYRTDIASAISTVEGVEFPESAQAINDYQVAPLSGAPNAAGAEAFIAYLGAPAARGILARHGFEVD